MEKMSKTVDEEMQKLWEQATPEQKRAQKMLRVKELLMKISEEDFDDLMKEIGSLIR